MHVNRLGLALVLNIIEPTIMFALLYILKTTNYCLDESSGSGEDEMEDSEQPEGLKRARGSYSGRIEELEKTIELRRIELQKEKGMADEERELLATELHAKEVQFYHRRRVGGSAALHRSKQA